MSFWILQTDIAIFVSLLHSLIWYTFQGRRYWKELHVLEYCRPHYIRALPITSNYCRQAWICDASYNYLKNPWTQTTKPQINHKYYSGTRLGKTKKTWQNICFQIQFWPLQIWVPLDCDSAAVIEDPWVGESILLSKGSILFHYRVVPEILPLTHVPDPPLYDPANEAHVVLSQNVHCWLFNNNRIECFSNVYRPWGNKLLLQIIVPQHCTNPTFQG